MSISRETTRSQEKRIFDWMNAGSAITPLEALRMFGCMRLGARIYNIKKLIAREGLPVVVRTDSVLVSDNKRVARYWIDFTVDCKPEI